MDERFIYCPLDHPRSNDHDFLMQASYVYHRLKLSSSICHRSSIDNLTSTGPPLQRTFRRSSSPSSRNNMLKQGYVPRESEWSTEELLLLPQVVYNQTGKFSRGSSGASADLALTLTPDSIAIFQSTRKLVEQTLKAAALSG